MKDLHRSGLPGDYHEAANSMRDQVRRAVKRGHGTRLTPDQVFALDAIMGDGEWWQESQ